jgi:hypothetical protein
MMLAVSQTNISGLLAYTSSLCLCPSSPILRPLVMCGPGLFNARPHDGGGRRTFQAAIIFHIIVISDHDNGGERISISPAFSLADAIW